MNKEESSPKNGKMIFISKVAVVGASEGEKP
jgi:hypothetical protein